MEWTDRQPLRRQLVKIKEKQHGDVKSHPSRELAGYVVRLFRVEGYGFIKTTEGRELYFHQNSVLHKDFERLESEPVYAISREKEKKVLRQALYKL